MRPAMALGALSVAGGDHAGLALLLLALGPGDGGEGLGAEGAVDDLARARLTEQHALAALQTGDHLRLGRRAPPDAHRRAHIAVALLLVDIGDLAGAEDGLHRDGEDILDASETNLGVGAHGGLQVAVRIVAVDHDLDGVLAEVGVAPPAAGGEHADAVHRAGEDAVGHRVDLDRGRLAGADAPGVALVHLDRGDHLAGVGEDDQQFVGTNIASDLEGAVAAHHRPPALVAHARGVDDQAVGGGVHLGRGELTLLLGEALFTDRQLAPPVREVSLLAGEAAGVLLLDARQFGLVGGRGGRLLIGRRGHRAGEKLCGHVITVVGIRLKAGQGRPLA